MSSPSDDEPAWLDDPANVWKIIYALMAACALLVVADLLHVYHKHGHYSWEEWPGFHAVYGFVACVGLVIAATQLRKVLMRDEGYYDD